MNEVHDNFEKSETDLTDSETKSPPNIVVCSDGTWNQGGAVNPTNVWRTYLVTSPENQIKLHDNGVGSEGIKLFQYFGGAFGYGISQNIQELTAFIIQSYQPGSKIYLFGFSRGAYTVRVLAELLCRYGIPRKEKFKTAEDVNRAAAKMLRFYKRQNSAHHRSNKFKNVESRLDAEIAEFQQEFCDLNAGDDKHLIHFLGCWDTVEALGVPFEPIKRIAKFFFRLRFRNTKPNEKIKTICHALSLDDERRAFHPLCFTDRGVDDQTVHQTWFPGNHCHVGGGYSRDQMAMKPLEWMIRHAENQGLKIDESKLQEFLKTGYTHGQLPNSREGLNFFYSYYPRRIDEFQRAGPWSIHVSAFERLGEQIQFYVPTSMMVDKGHVGQDGGKVDTRTFDRVPAFVEEKDDRQRNSPDYPTIFFEGGGGHLEYDQQHGLLPITDRVCLEETMPYFEQMKEVNEKYIR
ncbi:MAG: DUF2235 domain-containing protein, partial [Planctomycetota bacterium]